jgi:hypothetical protein
MLFFLSTLFFGRPAGALAGGFFTMDVLTVPCSWHSSTSILVALSAALTSSQTLSIPCEAIFYLLGAKQASTASPLIFLHNALYLSLLVARTPKQVLGDKRFSLIFMVASSDHLLSKYFFGICSTSQLVNTFKIWGHKSPSCLNMLQLHEYVVALSWTETL